MLKKSLLLGLLMIFLSMIFVSEMWALPDGKAISGKSKVLSGLVVRDGQFQDKSGSNVVFMGVNIFEAHQIMARASHEEADKIIRQIDDIADLGFNAIRLPLNWDYFEPALGVFPDNPEYAELMRSYGLPEDYLKRVDELIDRCAKRGIYVIPEFHYVETATKSYWDNNSIDWCDNQGPITAKETPILLAWIASYWKGNSTIAGFEIPFNEPHDTDLTKGKAFFDFLQSCGRAVKKSDPSRLVFMAMGEWGGGNIDPYYSWNVPAEVDAFFPHFYIGLHNPVPYPVMTNEYSAGAAVYAAPFRASGKPIMIGEWGDCMSDELDPDTNRRSARAIDSCLSQWFAAGVQGTFWWAWNNGLSSDIDNYKPAAFVTPRRKAINKFIGFMKNGVPVKADLAIIRAPLIGTSSFDLAPGSAKKNISWTVTLTNYDNSRFIGLSPSHWPEPGPYSRRPWAYTLSLRNPQHGKIKVCVKVKGIISDNFDFKGKTNREAVVDTIILTNKDGAYHDYQGILRYFNDGVCSVILEAGEDDVIDIARFTIHNATQPHNGIMQHHFWQTEALFDLHTGPFDIITQEMLIALPRKIAQYKCLLVDSRNMDTNRIYPILRSQNIPFKFVNDKPDIGLLEEFLTKNGVRTDRKNPSGILVLANKSGFLAYNRLGVKKECRIFPFIELTGQVRVMNADSKMQVFSGDASELKNGLSVSLDAFQAAVFEVEKR